MLVCYQLRAELTESFLTLRASHDADLFLGLMEDRGWQAALSRLAVCVCGPGGPDTAGVTAQQLPGEQTLKKP